MKKLLIFLITLVLLAGASIVGLKVLKKVWRHMHKPKMHDNRQILSDLLSSEKVDGYAIFFASSLDRIFKNGQTLQKPSFSKQATIKAARNEYEAFQLVVHASKKLEGISITPSDLIHADGQAKIAKENITWRGVGYVQTKEPYYPVKFIGLWPDPLLEQSSFDLNPDEFQPIWISVYVPIDAKAGTYKAHLNFQALGIQDRQIPIELVVYDFGIPTESHLKTAFDFYGHLTKVRYPQRDNESSEMWHSRLDDLNDRFIKLMLKNRINPMLNIDPTSQEELSAIDRYRALGLNNFSIGKKGGTFDNNWPKDTPSIEALVDTYRTYGEVLKMNRLLPFTYIYTWDEGEMGNPLVAKIASMIHRAYPDLKNMACYHGVWDIAKDPAWIKDIDIWTFQIDKFDGEKMKALQQAGKEIWMYVSGPSGSGAPNLAMDFDSIDFRILPWMCWKFDIRGLLYWCVNWWPNVDPFEHAQNSQWAQNGNGLLFYPGTDGPLSSMRVEILRDGMEDYEYIQLLLNNLRSLKAAGLEQKYQQYMQESVQLLTMDDNFIASTTHFIKNGETLNERREKIARQIMKFKEIQP